LKHKMLVNEVVYIYAMRYAYWLRGREGEREGALQSWTRRETFGLAMMLVVLREAGLVVMMMTGESE
jgi:hypothetical protein